MDDPINSGVPAVAPARGALIALLEMVPPNEYKGGSPNNLTIAIIRRIIAILWSSLAHENIDMALVIKLSLNYDLRCEIMTLYMCT